MMIFIYILTVIVGIIIIYNFYVYRFVKSKKLKHELSSLKKTTIYKLNCIVTTSPLSFETSIYNLTFIKGGILIWGYYGIQTIPECYLYKVSNENIKESVQVSGTIEFIKKEGNRLFIEAKFSSGYFSYNFKVSEKNINLLDKCLDYLN